MKKSIYRPENKYFVQVLIEFRIKAGLLQSDLAKKLKVHQSFISKIETGQRKVDLIELREICAHLNTNIIKFCKEFEKRMISSK